MIRLGFIIDTIVAPSGGTEKQLLLLIRNLNRERFSPHLYVLQSSEWLESRSDINLEYKLGLTSFLKIESLVELFRFARKLKEDRIDVLSTYFPDGNKMGVMAGRLAGVKAIVSNRRSQGYPIDRKDSYWLKILNRFPTLFLANSHGTKEWVHKTQGISRDRIRVIYNALDFRDYPVVSAEVRKEVRAELGIEAGAPVIGIVANLRPVKRHDVFLRAASVVRGVFPGARFLMIGEDIGQEKELRRLAGELGLSGEVRFLGLRYDVPKILRALDVGVLSSESESFPNAIVEYMASGLPAISTDVGGAREAIEDGVNGYVVPVGDDQAMGRRIVEVLRDGAGEKMGLAGRSKAESLFELGSIMSQYEGLFTMLAARNGES